MTALLSTDVALPFVAAFGDVLLEGFADFGGEFAIGRFCFECADCFHRVIELLKMELS